MAIIDLMRDADGRRLDALDLRSPTVLAIRRAGLTIEDLREMSDRSLLTIDDLGPRRLREIRQALAAAQQG